jgi:hypothetical protein
MYRAVCVRTGTLGPWWINNRPTKDRGSVRTSRKWGTVLVSTIGVVVALSGCSGTSAEETDHSPEAGLSLSPASNLAYQCLTEKGWDVELTWEGGIEASSKTVPDAQRSQYEADSDECWSVIDDRILNMKPEEIGKVYDSELKTRECLIQRGYDVGTPPSKQEYIDTFQGERWSAYGDSNALGPGTPDDEWRKISEACPQPAWSLGAS